MTGHHVRKQTDRQGKNLRNQADEFDRHQERCQHQRTRAKMGNELLPAQPQPVHHHHDQGHHRQRRRHPDVARGRTPEPVVRVGIDRLHKSACDRLERQQAQQVDEQDVKKRGPDVRDEPVRVFAENRPRDRVAEIRTDRLEKVAQPARGQVIHRVARVANPHEPRDHQNQQQDRDDLHDHVVGNQRNLAAGSEHDGAQRVVRLRHVDRLIDPLVDVIEGTSRSQHH